ncbi:UNVERIFIED_ORG: PH domain-containing protein [Bacillus sp. AZ43]
MRLLCVLLGAVVLGVMVYVALGLKETTNTVVTYRTSDQFAIVGLGLVLAAGIVLLGRSRVDADLGGVVVRNIAVHHRYPWQAVRAVRFDRKATWASLLLENGDEISVHAVQVFDGEYAVRAVEGLRALRERARADDPVPPPLLYDN